MARCGRGWNWAMACLAASLCMTPASRKAFASLSLASLNTLSEAKPYNGIWPLQHIKCIDITNTRWTRCLLNHYRCLCKGKESSAVPSNGICIWLRQLAVMWSNFDEVFWIASKYGTWHANRISASARHSSWTSNSICKQRSTCIHSKGIGLDRPSVSHLFPSPRFIFVLNHGISFCYFGFIRFYFGSPLSFLSLAYKLLHL